MSTAEHRRLRDARTGTPWKAWGPYLSDRQWGTVREDRSQSGDAWNDLPHDQARSRAYRWGEDGIAGISDEAMRLCFSLAFWNGVDPILKERLFGLTNGEGNHGEDVKECYYYLDSTPTHSYMRMLYKYPQRAFPYADLVKTNRERSRTEPEYELLDTGIFEGSRYFDVTVEYAKDSPDDIVVRVSIANRGPEAATIHVLPHLWFRNTWRQESGAPRPSLQAKGLSGHPEIVAQHPDLGAYTLTCDRDVPLLFTENETNEYRLFGRPNTSAFVKDGINDAVVLGKAEAVNASGGTKAAAWYTLSVPAGATEVIRLRLGRPSGKSDDSDLHARVDEIVKARAADADEFYAAIIPKAHAPAVAAVARQGFAGLLWSKQTYIYDVADWLDERGGHSVRNADWTHLTAADVISMPDKWEYPWFAAWDLAFQAVPFAFVDPDFAVEQLELLLRGRYLHPNGQIPAYEWNFSDVNPPVHAWAMLFIYRLRRQELGDDVIDRMRIIFHKLLLNFTWWVNRKDKSGRNLFDGGFLGLDNIGVFDRSAPLPTGGTLEQADGTAWMAFYAQTMLDMSIELARHDHVYEDFAIKFFDHCVSITTALDHIGPGGCGMWDEEDGFFYDVLRLPDGSGQRLKVRSAVGLLPLCAATVYPADIAERLPHFAEHVRAFTLKRPEVMRPLLSPTPGDGGRHRLSVLNEDKLRKVLRRMLDPAEFLSPYGVRALSRFHLESPYRFNVGGGVLEVAYQPAESDSGMFGGNSNWRGPIWMPINALMIRALLQLHRFYGDRFTVECPTGSGTQMTLGQVAHDLASRLLAIFLPDASGRRPVHGGVSEYTDDPHWKDLILFYEYFHGDNGAGVGASHQTGWTSLVSGFICLMGSEEIGDFLD